MKLHHKIALRERQYPVLTRIDWSMHLTLVTALVLCALAVAVLLLLDFGQSYVEGASQVVRYLVHAVKR